MTRIEIPTDSGFGLDNLPYGVYSLSSGGADGERRCARRAVFHVKPPGSRSPPTLGAVPGDPGDVDGRVPTPTLRAS